MPLRMKITLLVMVGVLGGGFLYLRVLAHRIVVEPPRQAEETVRTQLSQAALQSPTGAPQTATLYFPSPQSGKLATETRPVTWAATDTDRVRQVLLALVEGSHQGLGRVLPPTASVRGVFLTSDGTAYLDFPKEIVSGLTPGIETESLVIYALVDSIAANVPSVKSVRILIQGLEVDTLAGHVDLSEAFVPDPTRIQTKP